MQVKKKGFHSLKFMEISHYMNIKMKFMNND